MHRWGKISLDIIPADNLPETNPPDRIFWIGVKRTKFPRIKCFTDMDCGKMISLTQGLTSLLHFSSLCEVYTKRVQCLQFTLVQFVSFTCAVRGIARLKANMR